MNANHKIKEYTFTPKMVEMTLEQYTNFCNELDYEDAKILGRVKTDQSAPIDPFKYAFILGRICQLELLLMTFGVLKAEECYSSKQFKGSAPDEEE